MKLQNYLLTNHADIRVGGKASKLFFLEQQHIPVPKWGVIPSGALLEQLDLGVLQEEIISTLQSLSAPTNILKAITTYFGEGAKSKRYAVRSSALDEDGDQFSFAGQFETFLNVGFDELPEKVLTIWQSVASSRVIAYRKKNTLPMQFGIGVIIQEMLEPEISGVAFGMDPLTKNINTKVISSVYGLGEGLVSGELDADTYRLTGEEIQEEIAHKTQAIRKQEQTGIRLFDVEPKLQDLSSLTQNQIKEIGLLLDQLHKTLKKPQDIEFAIQNNQLFLLQTRPITTTVNKEEEYILWDNSNIIESYPGITTPLTFSFIIKMYESVYRQFVGLMGVKSKEIDRHAPVFAHTLGLVRGRVYYNLLNWYKMLAMLPGYSLNASYMETMMGVKERFELKEDYRMSKGMAWLRIIQMIFKMIGLQIRLPKERKKFQLAINETIGSYKQIDFSRLSAKEIIAKYQHFEQTLLLKWKSPLTNDFFAMIWFGMLKKITEKQFPKETNLHNDLLCGSQDIISVEPVHRTMAISQLVRHKKEALSYFKSHTAEEIWTFLQSGKFPKIKSAIEEYITKFGERCVGELKLETISYAQNPVLFVRILKSYVDQNVKLNESNQNLETEIRQKAESKMAQALRRKPLKSWWFNYVTRKTRDLVSSRENLRYERTRGFGMVRTMFSELGNRWFQNGALKNKRDIFYLKLDEILALSDGHFDTKLLPLIEKRKKEFASYAKQAAPMERFYTYGNQFLDEYIYSEEKIEPPKAELEGIGCCPGKVQAKVQVIHDPTSIHTLDGDILVTSSTDPGWVTLFPTASAIIVERGSLLSHSAIVSREMGIPCIVSVSGLLNSVKTGDTIVMDGSTGKIKILNHG